MKTDTDKYNQQVQLVAKALPYESRDNFVRDMTENPGTPLELAVETAAMIPVTYFTQAVKAFNRFSFVLALILVIFCWGFADVEGRGWVVFGAVLAALALRDGYLHNAKRKGDKLPPNLRHSLDSIGDAATAGLFALIAESVLPGIAPKAAMPFPNLWRGAVVCLPMIFTLKMFFRLKPDPNSQSPAEFDPEEVYRQVRRISLYWVFTFWGLVACSVTDIPNYWPDRLKGLTMVVSIGVWFAMQRNWFGRLNLRRLFMDPKQAGIELKKRRLAAGLKRKEPLYWGYVGIEISIYAQILLSMGDSVLPWLMGRSPAPSLIHALGSIFAGTILLLTWKFVKEANRVAAEALSKS